MSPSIVFANLLLIAHSAFIFFVVFGLILTWIGWALKWRWVRNFWFRLVHLLCILFVAVQAVFGAMCPLTVWEDQLRGISAPGPGFIERHLSRLIYYDFPSWVFVAAYAGFGGMVLITFILFPPRFPQWLRHFFHRR